MVLSKKDLLPSPISYVSPVLKVFKTEEKKTSITTDTLLETDDSTELNEQSSYHYHTGKILDSKTYSEISSVEWGFDYEGMVGEARVSIPYNKNDLKWIYRGVRCQLYVTRKINKSTPKEKSFYGFIDDVTITESGIDINLVSFSKLLEKPIDVTVQQEYRSKILKKIIKMAGLKPKINMEGLRDDLIAWSSVQNDGSDSSSDSSSSNNLGDGSMTEDEINNLGHKVRYVHMGSGHDPKKGFKNLTQDYKGDCYDITAGLYYAFNFKAGIKARDIVAHSSQSNSGTHHCCQIEKNGEWVYPAFYDHCTSLLGINRQMRAGKIDVAREPPSSDGSIPPYTSKWP